MKKIVTIAGVQTTALQDIRENVLKNIELIKKAAGQGAQIICLQELFDTIYFPQSMDADPNSYAEEVKGETISMMQKLAKELGVVLIVPIYEKELKGKKCEYHNTAVVIDEKGKILPVYRKVHIPHDPGFYEKAYFKQSDSGYQIYKTKFGTFAVLICFDQWFPEAARAVRLLGAEMVFYPTAIGNVVGYHAEDDWHEGWEVMQRSHAIANSMYIMAVNRVGKEGNLEFFGQSFVADPFGKVLIRASKKNEEIIVAEIDLEKNKLVGEDWGFLRNRRPESYKLLTTNKLVEKSKNLKKVGVYGDLQKSLGIKKSKKNGK